MNQELEMKYMKLQNGSDVRGGTCKPDTGKSSFYCSGVCRICG